MPLTPIPLDIQNRMLAMLARMDARGMLEQVLVFIRMTEHDNAGNPVARSRQQVLSFRAYVAIGGGQITEAQDGQRVSVTDQIYAYPDFTGTLSENNFGSRWIVLPARSPAYRRIASLQVVGPYMWMQLEMGGSNDPAGNVK